MVKYYFIFASFFLLLSILLTSMDVLTILMLALCYLITGALLKMFPLNKNLCKYVVLAIVFISVILIPGLHLVYDPGYTFVDKDYERLMSMGVRVYLASLASFYIAASLIKVRAEKYVYKPRLIKPGIVRNTFIFLILLTSFCFTIGLGRMGREAVALPFHLGGIINLFRSRCVPFLFAIVVENAILNDRVVPRKYYIMFGVWTIFEIVSWMSKGILLTYFLPVLATLYLYYRPSLKVVITRMAPLVVAFLFLYPVIGIMRSVDDVGVGSFWSTYKYESAERNTDGSANTLSNFILTPLNRQFLTATFYVQDYDYIKDEELFDFSNAPAIILNRGTSGYQTHVIDGFPDDAVHSSGTTGIIDPLLLGGYGLCYLTILIIMIIAGYTERFYLRKQYSPFIIMLLLVSSITFGDSITLFFNGVSMQYVFANLLMVLVAKRINFKNVIK